MKRTSAVETRSHAVSPESTFMTQSVTAPCFAKVSGILREKIESVFFAPGRGLHEAVRPGVTKGGGARGSGDWHLGSSFGHAADLAGDDWHLGSSLGHAADVAGNDWHL